MTAALSAPLADRLARHPLAFVQAGAARIGYRTAGTGTPLVLLHGIGSGSASWIHQLDALADRFRMIAWDAPGYGESTPLASPAPSADDYAAVLATFLDALGIDRAIVVGHSLGALMAGAFAKRHPARCLGLVLASPAGGYGKAAAAVRDEKLNTRLAMMDELGPEGLAAKRSGNLLSADASAEARELVRFNMSRLNVGGHAQAARMLAGGDLAGDVAQYTAPALVVCGSADVVTPETGCRAIASACRGAEYRTLPGLGHACYIESPDAFAAALLDYTRRLAA